MHISQLFIHMLGKVLRNWDNLTVTALDNGEDFSRIRSWRKIASREREDQQKAGDKRKRASRVL